MDGRTFELLPEGYREPKAARLYPLPADRRELGILTSIPITRNHKDSGAIYIRRATAELKKRYRKSPSFLTDMARREAKVTQSLANHATFLKEQRAEIREMANEVRVEAEKASASLKDLFSLGREGIDKQMKAYLAGTTVNEEIIDGAAFRECFRMVAQAVKGLGMPTDERTRSREAILEQAAEALRDTESALSLAKGSETEQ